MKGLFVFVLLVGILEFANAETVGVRAGAQNVYGQSQDLLDQTAFALQVEYTPSIFADMKSWLIEKDFGFIQNWNFVTEFGYTKYTGSELSRKTEYIAPSLQLRSGTDFADHHRLNYQFGLGVGALLVERDGNDSTQVTSNFLAAVDYQNLQVLPEMSLGIETGIIFDNEYPINYYGLFARYSKSF